MNNRERVLTALTTSSLTGCRLTLMAPAHRASPPLPMPGCARSWGCRLSRCMSTISSRRSPSWMRICSTCSAWIPSSWGGLSPWMRRIGSIGGCQMACPVKSLPGTSRSVKRDAGCCARRAAESCANAGWRSVFRADLLAFRPRRSHAGDRESRRGDG